MVHQMIIWGFLRRGDCSRGVRIGTKPGICVATGRFEAAKNRELGGEERREERATAVPEGKSNGSENHHSRDGVGKSDGWRRGGEKNGRGGSTVRE